MPTTIGRNDMKLTRREFGSMTLASLGLALPRTSHGAAASMPAGAIDCHNHVVGPQAKYPMAANRSYTPPEASVAQLKALRVETGATRNVIVQPELLRFRQLLHARCAGPTGNFRARHRRGSPGCAGCGVASPGLAWGHRRAT